MQVFFFLDRWPWVLIYFRGTELLLESLDFGSVPLLEGSIETMPPTWLWTEICKKQWKHTVLISASFVFDSSKSLQPTHPVLGIQNQAQFISFVWLESETKSTVDHWHLHTKSKMLYTKETGNCEIHKNGVHRPHLKKSFFVCLFFKES